jgi:hypothetical protein
MNVDILNVVFMNVLLVEGILAFYLLLRKRPKKVCFGEWGFEGENCELCRDVEHCADCSN